MPTQQVYLIRHGETEWSVSGQHTGITDIPLTENGRRVAKLLQPVLAKETFALVLTSPMQRARETCELAGLGERAEIDRNRVRSNKRTETAVNCYDSEIGRFLCLSSSKKGLDIETIFLAEKVGFYGFYTVQSPSPSGV
jgi:bisphosphoglycerate-dependent phosphoglycerate mutase